MATMKSRWVLVLLKAVVSGAGGDVAITCGELLFNPNATLADK